MNFINLAIRRARGSIDIPPPPTGAPDNAPNLLALFGAPTFAGAGAGCVGEE